MARGRKKDTDKTLELVIWILLAIPLAVFGFLKWVFSGLSHKEKSKSAQRVSESHTYNAQHNPDAPKYSQGVSPEPYHLNKNDLAQGEYIVGKDIPVGVYDFFVVHGTDGGFEVARYDENGKIINGTRTFYWVGLKHTYEKKELIHIDCKEGYTIKISGNVVLKIVKSQPVRIEL